MDKDAALLVVAKDLFLAGWKESSDLFKYGKAPENEPSKRLEHLADEFLAFHNKLRSGVGP